MKTSELKKICNFTLIDKYISDPYKRSELALREHQMFYELTYGSFRRSFTKEHFAVRYGLLHCDDPQFQISHFFEFPNGQLFLCRSFIYSIKPYDPDRLQQVSSVSQPELF